jgi:hypothetical protein
MSDDNKDSDPSKSFQHFLNKGRAILALLMLILALYSMLSGMWQVLIICAPFALILVPGYLEFPFRVRPPQHPALRMAIIFLPMPVASAFLSSYLCCGLEQAAVDALKMIILGCIGLLCLYWFYKRAGYKF